MKIINYKFIRESEVPTNVVGSGQIAGTGIGTTGEPPKRAIKLPLLKRKFSDIRNDRK